MPPEERRLIRLQMPKSPRKKMNCGSLLGKTVTSQNDSLYKFSVKDVKGGHMLSFENAAEIAYKDAAREIADTFLKYINK